MATTQLGTMLTKEQYRRQIAIRALLVRQIVSVWPLFDLKRIDETWPHVERLLMAAIEQSRTASALTAAAYYEAFRVAEDVPVDVLERPRLDDSWKDAAHTSLAITGYQAARRNVALKVLEPKAQTLVTVTGSASRHALNGGRDMLKAYVKSDPRGRGYARIASANACAFCQMLAGRGAVYGKESGDFAAHDHCSCSLEPVYRK